MISRNGIVTRKLINADTGICIETIKCSIRKLKAYGHIDNGVVHMHNGNRMSKYDIIKADSRVDVPTIEVDPIKDLKFGGTTAAHIDMVELQKFM
jgi:hypothetical protein